MSVPDLMNGRITWEFTPLSQTAAQDGTIEWTSQEVRAHIDHGKKKFCHGAEIYLALAKLEDELSDTAGIVEDCRLHVKCLLGYVGKILGTGMRRRALVRVRR
jgi:hypothetical protein